MRVVDLVSVSGERRAWFERAYAANYELVVAYAMRRTESRDDALDVVAETFLNAWRRFEQAPDGPELRLWLYGIARRVLANHVRGRRRQERLSARLRTVAEPARTTRTEAADALLGAVSRAFGRLKDADREVLTLVGAEGLAPGEIARVLGCSTVSARVRLHRARTRFTHELAAEGVQV